MAKASERRIPCLIHIPGTYPDGREIEPETLDRFLQMLDIQFGGNSQLGIVDGNWMCDEKAIREPMHRVEVAVKKKDLDNFEKTALKIGKEMKQKAMYVVINYQADATFLFVEGDDIPNDDTPSDDTPNNQANTAGA